jgi:ribosomal protein L7/L12
MGLTSILVILCAGALGMVLLAVLIIWLQNRQGDESTSSISRRPAPRPTPSPRLSDEHNFGLKVEIAALLQAGNKIQAIKVYREATGVGLKEAKDAVEAFEQGQMLRIPPAPTPTAPPTSSNLHAQVIELLKLRNKIGAIKAYREATGVGLKEAKDAVEAIERTLQ